jgi:hypothetical protein
LQVGQSSSLEASQQLQIEALPPVLVLQLERFLYDATTDGIVKIRKPIRLAPELEISLGMIFFVSFVQRLRIPGWLDLPRGHGTYRREICGVGELQAVRGALPPW